MISECMLYSPNGKTMFSSASSGSSVDVAAELAPEAAALLDVTDDVVASSSSTSSVVPLPTLLVVAAAGVFVAPPAVVMSSASSSSTSCSSVVTISTTGVVEGTVPAVGPDEEVVLVPVIAELADVAAALVAVAVVFVVDATVWAAVVTEFRPSVVGMVDEGTVVIPWEELTRVTVCETVVAGALFGIGDVAAIVVVVAGADDAVVVDSTAADGVVVCGGGVVVAGVVRPILTRYSSRYCWYLGLSCARKLSTCRTPRCLGDREK